MELSYGLEWDEVVLAGVIPSLHNRVLVDLLLCGDRGATAAEVSRHLFREGWALGLQSTTPRFRELAKDGLVCKSGKRRLDPATSRTRAIWCLTDMGRDRTRAMLKLSAFLNTSAP